MEALSRSLYTVVSPVSCGELSNDACVDAVARAGVCQPAALQSLVGEEHFLNVGHVAAVACEKAGVPLVQHERTLQ